VCREQPIGLPSNDRTVLPEPNEIAVRSLERPEPGAGEVLVETERTLASTGTEPTILPGECPEDSVRDRDGTYPFTPGYNTVGRVVEAGDGVTDLAAGDRVASRGPHAASVTVDATGCRQVPEAVPAGQASFFTIAETVMNGLRRGRVAWGEVVAVDGPACSDSSPSGRLAHGSESRV